MITSCCPAQWKGKTTDGREVYIRYDLGCLTVNIDGAVVYHSVEGPYTDRNISIEKLRRMLYGVFKLPKTLVTSSHG